MLQASFQVLLYAPNPNSVTTSGSEGIQNITYTYSLWYLEAHVRRNWLMSVLVIMYKVIIITTVLENEYLISIHFSTSTLSRRIVVTLQIWFE